LSGEAADLPGYRRPGRAPRLPLNRRDRYL